MRTLGDVPRAQDPPSYATSLSFLLSQVGAQSATLFAELLRPLGISPRAFGVLSNLASGASQTQQALADALGIHRNRMVGLIDDLEAAGLAERHRSAMDRRAFDVRLTSTGLALVDRVNELIPTLDQRLATGLTGPERRQLVTLLGRVAAGLALSPGIHPYLSGGSGGSSFTAPRDPELTA